MSVQAGDRILATQYNYAVMALPYVKLIDYKVKSNNTKVETKYAWLRGSRTDKNGTALPVPYPSYNTVKIYIDKSLGPGDSTYLEVYKITWDASGNEIETRVDVLFDSSFWSNGTTYYRYYTPGYYKFKAILALGAVFKWTRHIKVEIKPWQNQVESAAYLRSFNNDRSGLLDFGTGREFIAKNIGKGLYGDEFYLGGNHPDWTGD